MMSETRSIVLTIIIPTIILLLSQIGQAAPATSSDILNAIQTGETFSILAYSVWSLAFCIFGWFFFVDKKTFGLKCRIGKHAFAPYMLFLASIFASALLLHAILKSGL